MILLFRKAARQEAVFFFCAEMTGGFVMGNRILKDSILMSQQVDALDWFEEILFYRLIVLGGKP